MSSTRKLIRKNNRLDIKKQEISITKNSLRNNILSAVMALGVAAHPISALAADVQQNIVKSGNTNSISVNGNVTSIYADRVFNSGKAKIGNIAINEFKNFDLAANNIANMYFKQKNDTVNANNLVNLVGEKINIAGTVNAVSNGAIGGNLFFLSTQGMAVTKTGVINAGSLTVLTPNNNAMASLTGDNNTNVTAMVSEPSSIALNSSGTITIAGKINTTDNIAMYAGKEIRVDSSATIQTNVTNFNNLVNISGSQTVSANLG